MIMGDVGTGKTTLSRALVREFNSDDRFLFHMIIDPNHRTALDFSRTLARLFGLRIFSENIHDYKVEIERYLFQKGVDEGKTVVLIIDEGQKLGPRVLEVLRTLLNYETNEYKLLQLVILSQMELLPRIKLMNNFYDRITMRYVINPLDEIQTTELIRFRLRKAGYPNDMDLFTSESLSLIYKHTSGYPRKIAKLCHSAIEELIIQDKDRIDSDLISDIVQREEI